MKQLRMIILLTVLMSMMGTTAFAHDFAMKNDNDVTIYYVKTSDTEIAVSYQGTSQFSSSREKYTGSVVIPESVTYDGITYSVTSIGEYAFYDCSDLTYVFIPNSVKSIEGSAFRQCTGLTFIIIPNSVTSIGSYVFQDCTSLLFANIPDGVTTISYGAFNGCTSMTSITIGNGVTEIKSVAFKGCTALASVEIPSSVTSIYSDSFSDCTSLTQVTLNSSTIASRSSFTSLFGKQVTEYILGNDVKSIISSAFYKCTNLTSVTMGNAVTSIGSYAFYGCTGLTSIEIPKSVTSIGAYAFKDCKGLTSIDIPSTSWGSSIGDYAFDWCTGLTSVTLGDGVQSIGQKAFTYCSNLTAVTIPKNVMTISEDAFYVCSNLTQVTINSNRIVSQSYTSTSSMSDIFGSQVTDYIIGDGVTSIGSYAFYHCSSLSSITIPSSVTYIGSYAFEYCKSLTSVTIPNSVTSIGSYAFYNCDGLTSVIIPDGVTSIGSAVFYDCDALASVTIPSSVTYIGSEAFAGCPNLAQVTLNSNDIASKLYTSSSNISRIFGTQVSEFFLGDDVTNIGDYAFKGCTSLSSITFGDNIQSIGSDALPSCTKYVHQGTYSLLSLWIYGEDPTETGTTKVLYHPSVSVKATTQTTATLQLNNISYENYTYTYGDMAVTGSEMILTGLRPEQSLPTLKVSLGEAVFTTGDNYTTSEIAPLITYTQSATSITVTGSYTEGDAKVTGQRITLNGKTVEGNSMKATGLNPNTAYTATYEIDVAYGKNGQYSYSYISTADVTTSSITLTTQQPKVISEGNVVVSAVSNLDGEDENVGFEWRRIDWTDDFTSNTGKAYFCDGFIEGYIRNLNVNFLWKYRPYFESATGTKYYGEWIGVDPTNTGYYEPTVHTYANVSVNDNIANVKGYVQRGTDNVTSQGFKYWSATAAARRSITEEDVPANAITVTAKGQVMTAALTGLKDGTEYCYVAFATTEEGDTSYGELHTFTTESTVLLGDADGDGKVDVNDVTTTINYILKKAYSKFVMEAADVDGDKKIDVNDVQGIIDIALGKRK